jgi:hypothetical protein
MLMLLFMAVPRLENPIQSLNSLDLVGRQTQSQAETGASLCEHHGVRPGHLPNVPAIGLQGRKYSPLPQRFGPGHPSPPPSLEGS